MATKHEATWSVPRTAPSQLASKCLSSQWTRLLMDPFTGSDNTERMRSPDLCKPAPLLPGAGTLGLPHATWWPEPRLPGDRALEMQPVHTEMCSEHKKHGMAKTGGNTFY